MIEWLTDNAVWIGTLGAIVGILGFLWTVFKRDETSDPRKTIVAKNQSVATETIKDSPINIGSNNTGQSDG